MTGPSHAPRHEVCRIMHNAPWQISADQSTSANAPPRYVLHLPAANDFPHAEAEMRPHDSKGGAMAVGGVLRIPLYVTGWIFIGDRYLC